MASGIAVSVRDESGAPTNSASGRSDKERRMTHEISVGVFSDHTAGEAAVAKLQRLYSPRPEIVDATWECPPIRRVP
jgi:hypothetical protein